MKIVRKIFDKTVFKNRLPVNFKENDSWLFQTHLISYIHEIKLYKGTDILLFPEHILVENLKIWRDEQTNHYIKNVKYVIKRMIKAFLRDTIKLKGKYVLITDDWSGSYFHWTTDVLQRLYLIKDELKDTTVLIPEHFQKFSYIAESLSLFNVKVLYFSPKKNLRIQELLVPSPAGASGLFNYDVISGLSFYLKTHPEVTGMQMQSYSKIYISRAKAVKSKNINEDEIIALLRSMDFHIFYMEDLSFIQQAKLLSDCRYLVSLHGAGLTNELFLPSSANVLEIRHPKDHLNNCYYLLATALNLNYYYFLGDSEEEDPHSADININIASFRDLLAEFVLN